MITGQKRRVPISNLLATFVLVLTCVSSPTLAELPTGYESYDSRPDILTVTPKNHELGPKWTQYKKAMIETVAMLLEMYPDREIYFFGRDAEYLYDIARLAVRDSPIGAGRIHLINVTTHSDGDTDPGTITDPNLAAYLDQGGISLKRLKAGTKFLLFDTCCQGTALKAVIESFPEQFHGQFKGRVIESLRSMFPSIRVFHPDGGSARNFEDLEHYTDSATQYVFSNGRWQAVSHANHPEKTGMAEKYQQDIAHSILRGPERRLIEDRRRVWRELIALSRWGDEQRLERRVRQLLLEMDEAHARAVVDDLRVSVNHEDPRGSSPGGRGMTFTLTENDGSTSRLRFSEEELLPLRKLNEERDASSHTLGVAIAKLSVDIRRKMALLREESSVEASSTVYLVFDAPTLNSGDASVKAMIAGLSPLIESGKVQVYWDANPGHKNLAAIRDRHGITRGAPLIVVTDHPAAYPDATLADRAIEVAPLVSASAARASRIETELGLGQVLSMVRAASANSEAARRNRDWMRELARKMDAERPISVSRSQRRTLLQKSARQVRPIAFSKEEAKLILGEDKGFFAPNPRDAILSKVAEHIGRKDWLALGALLNGDIAHDPVVANKICTELQNKASAPEVMALARALLVRGDPVIATAVAPLFAGPHGDDLDPLWGELERFGGEPAMDALARVFEGRDTRGTSSPRIRNRLARHFFNRAKVSPAAEKLKYLAVARQLAPRGAASNMIEPPTILYHWTTQERLEGRERRNRAPNDVPIGIVKSTSNLGSQFPQLANRPGTFAWSNPLTGSAAPDENYSLSEDGSPPRLVAYKIRKDAKVLSIDSDYWGNGHLRVAALENYDLILNRCYEPRTHTLMYQEWIILNPAVVTEYTADPHDLRPIIQSELEKLSQTDFIYPPEELYVRPNDRYMNRGFWTELGRTYLKTSSDGIPARFMNGKHWTRVAVEDCVVPLSSLQSEERDIYFD